MRSFEHDYLLEAPISHSLLISVRALGEFRGRQMPGLSGSELSDIAAGTF